MGFSFKKVFSNPVKSLVDVGTFGATFALRESKIAPRLANNVTRVYAATVAGGASGLATGGVPGLFAGGAAGFGRGVSAAVHGEDINLKLLGAGAKWGAISGAATGAITGTGTAGFIRDRIFAGATKVPLPKVPGVGTSLKNIGGAAGLLSVFSKFFGSTSGVSVPPPENPIPYVPAQNPAAFTSAPILPSAVETPGLTTVLHAPPEQSFPWYWLAIAALVGFLILKRKRLAHGI